MDEILRMDPSQLVSSFAYITNDGRREYKCCLRNVNHSICHRSFCGGNMAQSMKRHMAIHQRDFKREMKFDKSKGLFKVRSLKY